MSLCSTGPGCVSPTLPQEKLVTQGPMRMGVWCLGWSAWGRPRAWAGWDSGSPLWRHERREA